MKQDNQRMEPEVQQDEIRSVARLHVMLEIGSIEVQSR